MDKKQLADMIKSVRKKKMEEMSTVPGSFAPVHLKKKGEEEASSPNQYVHRMTTEARVPVRRGKHDLGSPSRAIKLRNGNQKIRGRYLNSLKEKSEIVLGKTETGDSGETVAVNPKDNTNSARTVANNNSNQKTKEI